MDNRDREEFRGANDPALRALIDARDDTERHRALELVLRDARPVVSAVLATHRNSVLGQEDLEDIEATVMLRLFRRLARLPVAQGEAISSFPDFVARLTSNAVYDTLRQRFPRRTRLKNRLRHTLGRDGRFVTWLVNGRTTASLRIWGTERIDAIEAPVVTRDQADARMLDPEYPGDALEAVLRRFGKPIALDDLIRIFGVLWDISDDQFSSIEELVIDSTQLLEVEAREHLALLWQEIRDLPSGQRSAILLNLRDAEGLNAVMLLILTGTTTFTEVAGSLQMTTEQFAAIWGDLPMDDLSIAARLGVTRQQVINLRKSGRERLRRRMRRRHQWTSGS